MTRPKPEEEFDPRLHTETLEKQNEALVLECERLRAALVSIRDGTVIQGMSPELFAERVLREGG